MPPTISCPYSKTELQALYDQHGNAKAAGIAEGVSPWQRMYRWMKKAGVDLKNGRPIGALDFNVETVGDVHITPEKFQPYRAQVLAKAVLISAIRDAGSGDRKAKQFIDGTREYADDDLGLWCEIADIDIDHFQSPETLIENYKRAKSTQSA